MPLALQIAPSVIITDQTQSIPLQAFSTNFHPIVYYRPNLQDFAQTAAPNGETQSPQAHHYILVLLDEAADYVQWLSINLRWNPRTLQLERDLYNTYTPFRYDRPTQPSDRFVILLYAIYGTIVPTTAMNFFSHYSSRRGFPLEAMEDYWPQMYLVEELQFAIRAEGPGGLNEATLQTLGTTNVASQEIAAQQWMMQQSRISPIPQRFQQQQEPWVPLSTFGEQDQQQTLLPYMMPGAPITEQQAKACRCVLHVAARNPSWCNREKAWFQVRNGERCYNPYAVCTRSTGQVYPRNCTDNFDFTQIPDEELQAYAELKNLPVPEPYDRQEQLDIIEQYACQVANRVDCPFYDGSRLDRVAPPLQRSRGVPRVVPFIRSARRQRKQRREPFLMQ